MTYQDMINSQKFWSFGKKGSWEKIPWDKMV
jgi:hypothetical protein